MSTLSVTNIKAADGTSGLSIANSTGIISPTKPLVNPALFQVQALDVDQSYTQSALVKVQFNSVDLDTGSYWDSSNNYYRPQIAGWYMFGGTLRVNFASAVTLIGMRIVKNASYTPAGEQLVVQYQVGSDSFTNGEYPLATGMLQLNGSSDYVEVQFQSEEAATLNEATTRPSHFWGMLVHPT